MVWSLRWKIPGAIVALVVSVPVGAAEETAADVDFSVNPKVLSCSPSVMTSTSPLTLTLGPNHGQELGIRRMKDDAWYFLSLVDAPAEHPNFISPEEFASAKQLIIPAAVSAVESNAGTRSTRVFSSSGVYEVYVSENLESEQGGYTCSVHYVAGARNDS